MKVKMKADDILFPAPALVIGTYGEDFRANAMTVAWAGICSSEPPCIMISIRESRKTYENIKLHKAFTVNVPDFKHAAEVDYFGLVSGREEDKFEQSGLTPSKSGVDAPLIEEFPFALECNLKESFEVGSHIMVVGEIVNIQVDESCVEKNGKIDVRKIDPLILNTAENEYLSIGERTFPAFEPGLKFKKSKE